MNRTLLFGPILGKLPLLKKCPSKLSKAEFPAFEEQLRNQCIRRAWLDSVKLGLSERKLLDVYSGIAHVRYSEARREPVQLTEIDGAMEMAKFENECVVCTGFYIDELADKIHLRHGLHGPNPNLYLELQKYAELETELIQYRKRISYSMIAAETVSFVSQVTARPSNLNGPHTFATRIEFARAVLTHLKSRNL